MPDAGTPVPDSTSTPTAAMSYPPARKTTRWNGLRLTTPAAAEIIVKGPRHLICEHGLKPVLEIRWEPAKSRRSERVIALFEQEIGRPLRMLPADSLPDAVREHYRASCFAWDRSATAQALLLTCRSCSATVFIRLFRQSPAWLAAHPYVLPDMTCHRDPGLPDRWTIQDFSVIVPPGFALQSCAFSFGLSRLQFSAPGTVLRLCRLAPAEEHLKHSSLAALFASFAAVPADAVQQIDPTALRSASSPTGPARVFGLVRRKKSYQIAGFTHDLQHDRILGYSLQSVRAIDTAVEETIRSSYAIIQEEAAGSDPDP